MGISLYLASKAKKNLKISFLKRLCKESPKPHVSLPVTTQPPTMDVKLKSRLRTQAGLTHLKTTEMLTTPLEHPNQASSIITHSNLQAKSSFVLRYCIFNDLIGQQSLNSTVSNTMDPSSSFHNYSISQDSSMLEKLNSSNISEISPIERRRINKRFKNVQETRAYSKS